MGHPTDAEGSASETQLAAPLRSFSAYNERFRPAIACPRCRSLPTVDSRIAIPAVSRVSELSVHWHLESQARPEAFLGSHLLASFGSDRSPHGASRRPHSSVRAQRSGIARTWI
jgi:hypothetical protein